MCAMYIVLIIIFSIVLFLEIVDYVLRFIKWILKRKLEKIKQENENIVKDGCLTDIEIKNIVDSINKISQSKEYESKF